jgi:RNA recognition motif-containing protein
VNIYVGNLSFDVTDATLRAAFEAHGEVSSAQIITDRETGRARGFGFVEMPSGEQAKAAIAALNGTDLQGRAMNVNEAKPRADRRDGGGGGGRSGGGDRGGRRPSW